MDNKKWITKNRKVINLSEMTDEHLLNAISYSLKNEKHESLCLLRKEIKRRKYSEYMNKTRDCPFCNEVMVMKKFTEEAPIEVGFNFNKIFHRFHCPQCGSLGPIDYVIDDF